MPTRQQPRLVFRLCGFTLLLLVCLPVTAPFSTLDLADFFRDEPADAGSLMQAKGSSDKLVAAASAPVTIPADVVSLTIVRPVRASDHPSRTPVDIPLRL